ncbi:MAG: tRNA (adenosine(37)-N6)-threonylcarbamoyltransferase complex ATPase subunit type 1 TsaE [Candidatus Parcubacteria bacterium]|nr:MAG: tRNA (adenosine(37)-N6)-threonylcarbamoyltransferase complex ATPase subunit type 1 TsaE [Candidatus Parcubacteria bacterium]
MIFIENLKSTKKFVNEQLFPLIKKELIRNKKLTIILKGNLGAGKTTLVRFIARKFRIRENIVSPTFILWRMYKFNLNSQKFYLNHIDLYRIKAKDILKLSLKNKLNELFNLNIIEWGEKLTYYFNKQSLKYLLIEIKIIDKNKRVINLKWKK